MTGAFVVLFLAIVTLITVPLDRLLASHRGKNIGAAISIPTYPRPLPKVPRFLL